jgi:hypothetical protein
MLRIFFLYSFKYRIRTTWKWNSKSIFRYSIILLLFSLLCGHLKQYILYFPKEKNNNLFFLKLVKFCGSCSMWDRERNVVLLKSLRLLYHHTCFHQTSEFFFFWLCAKWWLWYNFNLFVILYELETLQKHYYWLLQSKALKILSSSSKAAIFNHCKYIF